MLTTSSQKPKPLPARIVSGSVVLLSGSGLATGINFAYNIAVARSLGPKGFGHATAVYTLLTLISAITLSFQLVSAKVVAQQKSPGGKAAGYQSLHRGAWICGLLVALGLLLCQGAIAGYLNLPSPVLVVLLSIGAAFYVPLGSRRGYLQGAYGFRRLATNLVLEGGVRLGGSLLLILLGLGVRGVIAANSAAVAVAYLAIVPDWATTHTPNPVRLTYALRETTQAIVFYSGQVLINNCDIVLVKHFFLSEAAGLYAAVAMVGRVVFAFSSAVVNSMFPLVAGTSNEDRKDLKVIATSLLLVLAIGSAIAIGLRFAPAAIWTVFFGARFQIAGEHGLPYLLALYAITTVVYSLSAVIISYEMSYKIANTSWVQLAFSGVVIAGISRYHSSLRQVILVQLVLMLALLVFVAVPFLVDFLTDREPAEPAVRKPLRLIRQVSEDEVIAEFLRSDFDRPVFRKYQETLRAIVTNPNLDDPAENEKRRALFFLRHLALWNELPQGTKWYEMQGKDLDLDRIRVFPRAQWRKIARGNFSLTTVADCLYRRRNSIDEPLLMKIDAIRNRLLLDGPEFGPVLLIGMSKEEHLTILDGNHRLVAAILAAPSRVYRLRFLVGISPRMMECCWYNTNLSSLLRYGRNLLKYVIRPPKARLAQDLRCASELRTTIENSS